MLRNVAMRMEDTESSERILVKGRGELHISILIENMRREAESCGFATLCLD